MRASMAAWVGLAAVVVAGSGLSLIGVSRSRLPPAVATRSRAADTPVLDHVVGGGPHGGAVLGLAVTRTRPHSTFVALSGGGVYRTTDHGVTWLPADRGLPADGYCELVADAVDGDTLYAECFDGLFKTIDSGGLWRQLNVDHPRPPIIAPANPRVLYVGTLRSRDGGRRWTTRRSPRQAPYCGPAVVDIRDSATLYCISDNRLLLSRDGGARWRAMPSPAGLELWTVVVARGQPDRLLVTTSEGRLYATTDRGRRWTLVSVLPDGVPAGGLISDDAGTTLHATQGDRLVRSDDGGQTWRTLPAAWPPFSFRTFAVDPVAPQFVYVGTATGPYVSVDGGRTFLLQTHGLTRAPSAVVVHEGPQPALFASAGAAVFSSHDAGDSWSPVSSAEFPDAVDAGSLLSDGAGGVLARSGLRRLRLPAGASAWSDDVVTDGLGDGSAQTFSLGELRLDDTDGRLRYSGDGGTTWHQASLPAGLMPTAIVQMGGDSRHLLAAVGGLRSLRQPSSRGMWRSSDAGATWTFASEMGRGVTTFCCRLFTDPNDASRLYAVQSGMVIGGGGAELLLSQDRGDTWTAVGLFMGEVALVPTTPSTLLAQHDRDGIVRSTDGGVTWTSSSVGLPVGAELTSVAFDRRQPTTIFAATSNRGVYRSHDGGRSWAPTGPTVGRGGAARRAAGR